MTRHDEPAEGDVAGVSEVLAAHYATGGYAAHYATLGEHVPGCWGCSCGAGGPVASGTRVVAAHRAHVADALRDLLAAAWDEGHRTRQKLGDDDCRCGAWAEIECACGKYGSNVITPNPYRTTERAQ